MDHQSPRHMNTESQQMGKPFEHPANSMGRHKATTLMKYLLAMLIVAVGAYITHGKRYLVAGMLELLAIAVVSNWLALRRPRVGNVVNGLLMLAFNIQGAVLVFGTTHVSLIMLTNLFNLTDLAGKLVPYLAGAVAAIAVSFLPIAGFEWGVAGRLPVALTLAAGLEVAACLGVGVAYAPLGSWVDVALQWKQQSDINAMLAGMERGSGEKTTTEELSDFYRAGVANARSKPTALPDKPNLIVIFTEGLSQHIVDDDRGLMPNVARYQQQSLSFMHYFNHTAATYRGINGQLYSGFQLNDLDANALISLQSILSDQGYHTTFINPEPDFAEWCNFLTYLEFDDIVEESATGTYSIANREMSMSDGEAYQTLRDVVTREAAAGEPFFTAIYTFGTHVSFDSPEQRFGDGSNPLLNKFYNCDYQFGQFMEWFESSPLAENTIIVFTADHATYGDLDFAMSFPDYERTISFSDTIPLFVYYKGVRPEQVDAQGRTSLNFAPTILDFLDVSAPNCFLGSSLFQGAQSELETVYYDGNSVLTSRSGATEFYEDGDEAQSVLDQVLEYVAVSRIPLG